VPRSTDNHRIRVHDLILAALAAAWLRATEAFFPSCLSPPLPIMLRTATTALAFAASASAVPTPDTGVMRVPVTVQPAKFSTKAPGTVRVMPPPWPHGGAACR
jgi:hypothetical protein